MTDQTEISLPDPGDALARAVARLETAEIASTGTAAEEAAVAAAWAAVAQAEIAFVSSFATAQLDDAQVEKISRIVAAWEDGLSPATAMRRIAEVVG